MKKWNAPAISCVEISKTEHKWLGNSWDGGYIGDGELSGHLEWKDPRSGCGSRNTPTPDPVDPVDPVDFPS